jgi:hypothetical protein
MWGVNWRLQGKTKNLRKAGKAAFLLSGASLILTIGQLVLLIFMMEKFIPAFQSLGVSEVLTFLIPGITFSTSVITYLLGSFRGKNKTTTIQPQLLAKTTATSVMTVGLLAYVIWITSGGLCGESDYVFASSNYSNHTDDLCYKRQDKSECPDSPAALRAFRPAEYDQLQLCYYPAKDDYGYILKPRLLKTDIF